jgi:hypothetical protein
VYVVRHYLSYDADGKLVGIHTHHHAGTKMGGWPDDCQLHNPNCQNPTSVWFRANVVGKNGVIGFIALECDCSPTETTCSCASIDFATKKVVGGVLVSKLEGALLNGGTPITNGATLKRTPGTKLTLKVACVGVPDGTKMDLHQRGTVTTLEEPHVELTFTDGETPTFEMTTPAQGLTGGIFLTSKDVIGIGLSLMGWA